MTDQPAGPDDANTGDDEPGESDAETTDSAPMPDGDGLTSSMPDTHHGGSGGGSALLSGLIDRQLAIKTAIGFVVAVAFIAVLVSQVGWRDVLSALSRADPRYVALACLSTVLGLAAWGKAWQIVLRQAGVSESYSQLVVTYFAATFANYVTPLGQAGGEPFIAYVLSKDTDASYQDSLASVVTADLLNLLPFFNFAAVGLAFLLWTAKLPPGAEALTRGLAVMAFGVPGLIYVGWRHRDGVESVVLRLVRPVAARTTKLTVEGVRRRIEEFYGALERITEDPWTLLYALVFSYVGWVFFAAPLYLGAVALGYDIRPLVVLFIVPASTLAGISPTPGGLGAVDATLAILIVALTPLVPIEAAALVAVYRFASFVFAILVGAVAAFWVTWRTDL